MTRAKAWRVVLALPFVAPAIAQETCQGNESFNQCYERIYTAASANNGAKVKEETQTEQKLELAKAQTGADTAGTATASTLTDLAPLFKAMGLLSNAGENDGTLAFDLNFLLPVQDNADKNAQLKLVANPAPEPLTQLVDAFPENVRAARKDALQKNIRTFGDTRIAFTYSLVNRRFGRDMRVHRATLEPLYQGAIARATRAEASAAQGKKDLALQTLTQEMLRAGKPAAGADDKPFDSLGLSDVQKAGLMAAAAEAARANAVTTVAIRNELNRSRIARAADLVSQQPQLLFTLSHDLRDEIVGPEKTSATLTWEVSKTNLTSFLRGAGKSCTDSAVAQGEAEYVACASALASYLGDEAENLQSQGRLKLSASYQRVRALSYSYPDDGVTLDLPETDRIEVAVGYGRPLKGVRNADRIDFELAYDSNIDNDTSNKERVKASLTYTRRVGDVDMPFSLVYANKNEFLGALDHQISMHFGVKFKSPMP